MKPWAGGAQTIRFRLGVAIALALIPVLLLGAVQSAVAFQKSAQERKISLAAAAERSVAFTRAQLESATVVLRAMTPGTANGPCAARLGELMVRTPGLTNLIRLDRSGRVGCSATGAPGQASLSAAGWFERLRLGQPSSLDATVPPGYAPIPSLLVAARAEDSDGQFDGALAGLISLASLRPQVDHAAPAGTEVALIDRNGRVFNQTRAGAFSALPPDWVRRADPSGGLVYPGHDRDGVLRVFTIIPLVGHEIYAVMSAPSPGPFSWARLNLLSSVIFPLIAFLVSLAALWVAADVVIVRWLRYMERIAAIYAKGRFSVRPLRAERAPREIRELADTLEAMARTIVARDNSLIESLAHKDALLREIHHRVKNNLQVITSLLNLQQRSLTDPSAREAMSDTRQRINALALIYRALYEGADLRRVELRGFLEQLIAQLIVSDQNAPGAVQTELHADDLEIHPDKLAPLALFAVEAISNARKHAFAGRGGGRLNVAFHVAGETAELTISDDGPGGAAPDDAPTSGVGRTLMTAFARQLHGQATFTPNAEGGVTVRLAFPLPDVRPLPFQPQPARPETSPVSV